MDLSIKLFGYRMKDESLAGLAVVGVKEGEEHLAFLLTNEASHMGKALVTDGRVPGRILGKHVLYEKLGAEPYIIQVVRRGYGLEFEKELPPPSWERNNKSAREEPAFVKAELERLEKLGCVKKVTNRPHVVLALSVVSKWISCICSVCICGIFTKYLQCPKSSDWWSMLHEA